MVWDSETQRQIVSLGAKQSPSLAYSLGFHHDPGALSYTHTDTHTHRHTDTHTHT